MDAVAATLLAIFALFIGSLFTDREVTSNELEVATYLCGTANSEVRTLTMGFPSLDVECNNSATFSIRNETWNGFQKEYDKMNQHKVIRDKE